MVNQVLRNFSRFREATSNLGEQKSYRALLDTETGEMKFPQKIREIHTFRGEKTVASWQEVLILKEHHQFVVQGGDLQKLTAKKIVEKTLEKINSDQQRKEIQRLPGWKGQLTAIQAEEKLRSHEAGTYLIRNFDDVSSMIEAMKQEYNCEILYYSVVVVSGEKKFLEVLLLNVPWGWLVYRDEPNLFSYQVFASPKKLIESLGVARRPL